MHGGALSYPMLPAPWGAPEPNTEVPFGRDVLQQFVQTEKTPALSWGAAVMVGELVAGDGFFAPKDGAEIVLRCVTGTFYGNAEVTRHDTKSQAVTVDGHDGWLMESDLSFSIPGLEATNELLTVVIVDLKTGSAGLFASSVPGNTPQYNEPAKQAMEGLRGLLRRISLPFGTLRLFVAQAAEHERDCAPNARSTTCSTHPGTCSSIRHVKRSTRQPLSTSAFWRRRSISNLASP